MSTHQCMRGCVAHCSLTSLNKTIQNKYRKLAEVSSMIVIALLFHCANTNSTTSSKLEWLFPSFLRVFFSALFHHILKNRV